MTKTKWLCLFFCFFFSISIAQQIADNALIEWNEFLSLQWDDFQGKAPKEAAGDAGTVVQIKAKPYKAGDKIRYDVHVYFNKNKSWSREKSDALLDHEKLHFDLAELYGRLIRRKISELNNRKVSDVKVYNAAITEILEESNNADIRYDLETLHGALPKKQAEWKERIKNELQTLSTFKRRKQVITAG